MKLQNHPIVVFLGLFVNRNKTETFVFCEKQFNVCGYMAKRSQFQLFGWGGGLSRSDSPGLRVFCDASHLYHKKHFVRNSLCELRHPQPMDILLCSVEHGYLPRSRAAWYMNESRTQNFRGISECTTKIQAQDCERTCLAAIDIKMFRRVLQKLLDVALIMPS